MYRGQLPGNLPIGLLTLYKPLKSPIMMEFSSVLPTERVPPDIEQQIQRLIPLLVSGTLYYHSPADMMLWINVFQNNDWA